ncbi:hypothetical protein GCM10011396_38630 [Undibacterium terreum]|uniref:Uncharacterized protein n=1 Tax=Undibacterium terreum TaxID=1224302 RepID=A0A916XMR7_9BURK|nr:hypothetical protein GCM10011396_38630 [Undibacterium terreum]
MQGDLNDIQNIWVPGKKICNDGLVTGRDAAGADLTKGFRASRRIVIVYNSSNEIAVYAKFTPVMRRTAGLHGDTMGLSLRTTLSNSVRITLELCNR